MAQPDRGCCEKSLWQRALSMDYRFSGGDSEFGGCGVHPEQAITGSRGYFG